MFLMFYSRIWVVVKLLNKKPHDKLTNRSVNMLITGSCLSLQRNEMTEAISSYSALFYEIATLRS